MSDITCIDCKHWYFDGGERDWSEVTPGSSWSSACRKGHWSDDLYDEATASYRKKLLTARRCKDFEQAQY